MKDRVTYRDRNNNIHVVVVDSKGFRDLVMFLAWTKGRTEKIERLEEE